MIKLIFIVLTQFFHFNQLKILRQLGYFFFFKLNQQYIFTVYELSRSKHLFCVQSVHVTVARFLIA